MGKDRGKGRPWRTRGARPRPRRPTRRRTRASCRPSTRCHCRTPTKQSAQVRALYWQARFEGKRRGRAQSGAQCDRAARALHRLQYVIGRAEVPCTHRTDLPKAPCVVAFALPLCLSGGRRGTRWILPRARSREVGMHVPSRASFVVPSPFPPTRAPSKGWGERQPIPVCLECRESKTRRYLPDQKHAQTPTDAFCLPLAVADSGDLACSKNVPPSRLVNKRAEPLVAPPYRRPVDRNRGRKQG